MDTHSRETPPRAFTKFRPVVYLRVYGQTWTDHLSEKWFQWNVFLWLVLLMTNLIDIMFSYAAFAKGAVEINPTVSIIIRQFGYIGLAFQKGIPIGALLILLPYIRGKLQYLLGFSVLVYLVLASYLTFHF
jgi:hypothetical protein